MIEGSWLCLVLVLPNLKRLQEDKLFYDEEDVRFSSPKTVETFFARNLLSAKPAKRFSKFCYKSAHCQIENFTANSEKNPARFGSKSAKMTTLLSRFKNAIFRHRCVIQKGSRSTERLLKKLKKTT